MTFTIFWIIQESSRNYYMSTDVNIRQSNLAMDKGWSPVIAWRERDSQMQDLL